jgi:hypothetical protein
VKADVEWLIADYKADKLGCYIGRHELVELCRTIASQKKSTKQSLNKLLTTLLGDDVAL